MRVGSIVSAVACMRTVKTASGGAGGADRALPDHQGRERRRGQDTGQADRYVRLTGATKSVNRTLEANNRALAGIKGYITNLPNPEAEQVIGACSQLMQVEQSFRMSKTDLAARPIFHHTRKSIEAHLTIVFAALAVSRWIEHTTGWSIKRFVTTVRRYRTIQIQAGEHTITAVDPLPEDLYTALDAIHGTH